MTLEAALVAAVLLAPAAPKSAVVGVQIMVEPGKDNILITAVIADSPAAKAGLKGGDVLLSVDGVKPKDLVSAVAAIRALTPGKKVTFLIRRDGKEKEVSVTPAEAG